MTITLALKSYLNMLYWSIFGGCKPSEFNAMSILHWSIFNDLFQAPQGSGGRHSATTRLCWIKAIGSGAPTVGNSTRRRRAWPVIELEDRGLTARSRLRLLPRLLLLHSSSKQCRGRDGRGGDDRGQPSSSSKEDSASCSSNFDAANTDTSLGSELKA